MSRRGENIYKRKDGRWEGRFLDSYNRFGKPKYRSVYAKTYSEVKEKVDSHKKQIVAQSNFKSLKLANYCTNWLETVRLRHKASTYSKYRNICQNHIIPSLGGCNAALIGEVLVEDFLAKKLDTEQLSAQTVSGILCVLKQIFTYIEGLGVRTNCNFSNISVHQNQRRMRVLTLSEQKKLADFLMQDMDNIKLGVYPSLFTGIHIGELCALLENFLYRMELPTVRYRYIFISPTGRTKTANAGLPYRP